MENSEYFNRDNAGGRLEINLAAIAQNYFLLSKISPNAETAAAVKADAYGLGLDRVAPILAKCGCRTFFVALPDEGVRLRKLVPDATIYVLAGIWPTALKLLISNNLTPVLNTLQDVELWSSNDLTELRDYALHFDTGMNRLGLGIDQLASTAQLKPQLIMSHFACGDDPSHPLNNQQLRDFLEIRQAFPDARASLANSAAILSRKDCQFDLVRPGIALYGGAAVNGEPNPMKPTVRLEGRILQVRQIKNGGTIGYAATHKFSRDSRVAIVAAGYADGYHRATEVDEKRNGYIAGHKVPLVGRISMDLSAFDITDIPVNMVNQGDWIELMGDNIPVDDVAASTGTIDYEILTSLGRRFARTYINR